MKKTFLLIILYKKYAHTDISYTVFAQSESSKCNQFLTGNLHVIERKTQDVNVATTFQEIVTYSKREQELFLILHTGRNCWESSILRKSRDQMSSHFIVSFRHLLLQLHKKLHSGRKVAVKFLGLTKNAFVSSAAWNVKKEIEREEGERKQKHILWREHVAVFS